MAICSRWHSVSKRSRCGTSRGSQMKPPGSMLVDSSPHVHVTLPSSRYQPSSSLWWMWRGVCPAGVLKSSRPSAPPVLSPLALMVIKICRYQSGSPPSWSRAKNSFDMRPPPPYSGMRGRHLRAPERRREVGRELLERAGLAARDALEVPGGEISPTLGVHAPVVDDVSDEPRRETKSEHRLACGLLRQGDVLHGLAQNAAKDLRRFFHGDRLWACRVVDLSGMRAGFFDHLGGEGANVAAVDRPDRRLAHVHVEHPV